MARSTSPLRSATGRYGPATVGTVAAIALTSIVAALLGQWAEVINLPLWGEFQPRDVLHGQVWRLITYPLFVMEPWTFVFGLLALMVFMTQLEQEWGTRRTLRRVGTLVILAPLIVALFALVFPRVRDVGAIGPLSLVAIVVAAFASALPERDIGFLFMPFRFGGDNILWVEAALILIAILFAGSVMPYLVVLISFGLAVSWFRFDLMHDLRKPLRAVQRRYWEARLRRLKKKRSLRVVSDDDDDEDSHSSSNGGRGPYLN